MKVFGRIFASLLLAAGALAVTGTTAVAQNQKGLPDSTIKTIVEYRLVREDIQRNNNVRVSVEDGVVTLTGTVLNAYEKRRAERAARGVDDVMRVDNRLTVNRSSRSDQQIASEIASSIRSFAFFDIFDWVEGEVKNGVLTLRGQVREPWRKDDYGRLAERVEGVSEVRNQIDVLPTSIYDDQLRIAVARLIYNDPRFVRYANRSLPPIHIIVDNGKIWLKGAVATPLEKQLAETIVRTGVMAFDVVNDLRVDKSYEQEARR